MPQQEIAPPGDGGTAALADYYPAWLDNLADDVTLEGSMMDGAVQGAAAVRAVLVAIRPLYDVREFHFVGPHGENGLLEDYTARVGGEAIGNYTESGVASSAGELRRLSPTLARAVAPRGRH